MIAHLTVMRITSSIPASAKSHAIHISSSERVWTVPWAFTRGDRGLKIHREKSWEKIFLSRQWLKNRGKNVREKPKFAICALSHFLASADVSLALFKSANCPFFRLRKLFFVVRFTECPILSVVWNFGRLLDQGAYFHPQVRFSSYNL